MENKRSDIEQWCIEIENAIKTLFENRQQLQQNSSSCAYSTNIM